VSLRAAEEVMEDMVWSLAGRMEPAMGTGENRSTKEEKRGTPKTTKTKHKKEGELQSGETGGTASSFCRCCVCVFF